MDNIYIKKNDLKEYQIKMLDRVGYRIKDLISIDDLLETIDNLLYELDEKDEEIEYLKNSEPSGAVEPDYYDEWHDRKMCEEE
jgi:hypothetical protein